MKQFYFILIVPIRILFTILGILFSLFRKGSIYNLITEIRFSFYKGYYSSAFKSLGTNLKIKYKIDLIGSELITIGSNFEVLGKLRLGAFKRHNDLSFLPEIIIGDNVSINFNCHISCINKVQIGDNVLMASHIFITDHYHGKIDDSELKKSPSQRELYSPGPVIIENNVWIGEGVTILPNVIIGENCIIGANSVVTKSFPKNSVIVGSPAKVIKKL